MTTKHPQQQGLTIQQTEQIMIDISVYSGPHGIGLDE
jgi:hypothetical protein